MRVMHVTTVRATILVAVAVTEVVLGNVTAVEGEAQVMRANVLTTVVFPTKATHVMVLRCCRTPSILPQHEEAHVIVAVVVNIRNANRGDEIKVVTPFLSYVRKGERNNQ